MRIDQTRLKAFWDNPERYRLAYELNLTPVTKGYGLDRGLAFHIYLDLCSEGLAEDEIIELLTGGPTTYKGQQINLDPRAAKSGIEMAHVYLNSNRLPLYVELLSEAEFEFEIPGSIHSGVGRMDKLVRLEDGREALLEFKTASAKTSKSKKETEWLTDKQADFEILGARSLGYNPEVVLVQYVIESVPLKCWEPLEVVRSESELNRTLLLIHQTCELIESLRLMSVELPWPHLDNWKCVGDKKWCEFSGICQRQGLLTPESLGTGWKKREEHLELLQSKE